MYIRLKIYLKRVFYKVPLVWKFFEFLQGVMFFLDYFYYYKISGYKSPGSIRELNIEFTTKCNLRCRFCSLDHKQETKVLTPETLERFLSDLVFTPHFTNVEVINLHNGGEALMHPDWASLLTVIKKYRSLAERDKRKFPKVSLLTNGQILLPKNAEIIVGMGVVDSIGVSLDGGTPAAYEDIRVNAKWSRFYNNVKQLQLLNQQQPRKIELFGICCIPGDKPLNTEWMDPEFREILHLLDRFELRRLHSWGGLVSSIKITHKRHKLGCTLLMRQLVLLPNGDITVCCNDLNGRGVIGNITQDSLWDIYKSKNRMHYLKCHFERKKSKLELCKDCETF